jgi:hypothetical protein
MKKIMPPHKRLKGKKLSNKIPCKLLKDVDPINI